MPTAIRRTLFVYKVTIPEGTISFDIYTLLSKQTGIPVSEFITAAKDPVALGVDTSWFTAKRDDNRPRSPRRKRASSTRP